MRDANLLSISVCLFFFSLSFASYLRLAINVAVGSTSVCDPSTEVACRNHPSICIELERVQDGVADCPDASDEGESNLIIHLFRILVQQFSLLFSFFFSYYIVLSRNKKKMTSPLWLLDGYSRSSFYFFLLHNSIIFVDHPEWVFSRWNRSRC